ncbi:SDR family oxidoreductase [Chryseobacterium sp. Ch-15]|uniref:dTDP-4-dehydrorhamnose reductase n=1 Tax=Chryseobacterium muglaense TaxID=2893752 RepID=A0A9Q3YSV6_9FLAO|nr:SDR family oxidoreductase [Chryseobacterium muglaense]MBD3905456.1 SDR family oxidoreductase [Chryseobacterium muglaense]MCC9036471.1 SDR family oxidoreductase [Chryseobacterium muglaense]MCM2555396.1 SDR family oxidoreductase [Chryseobacterium muglaense]
MKKILIIGIKGMAGHVIYNYLHKNIDYKVFGIARNIEENDQEISLDVSDTTKLKEIILNHNFDTIVNCIGILNKDAEDNPSKAIWFNSYFPHFLEEITKESQTQVIHISTDCVFNGKKGNYAENDFKDGDGFYAQSKALGEIINDKDLTIRTSIIGPELKNGIGLFHWFMNQSGEINGYTSAYWSGVTTLELAKTIECVIKNPLQGLVHLTNGVPINKFDLVNLFKDIWNKDQTTILPYEGKNVDKSLQKSELLKYEVKSYKDMLIEQSEWMKEFSYLYNY